MQAGATGRKELAARTGGNPLSWLQSQLCAFWMGAANPPHVCLRGKLILNYYNLLSNISSFTTKVVSITLLFLVTAVFNS